MLEQIIRLSKDPRGFYTENDLKNDLIKLNREQKHSPDFLCIILQCCTNLCLQVSVHALCMWVCAGRKYNHLIFISFIQEGVISIQRILIISQRPERTADAQTLTLWKQSWTWIYPQLQGCLVDQPAAANNLREQQREELTTVQQVLGLFIFRAHFKTTPSISFIFLFKARPWWENQSALFWILGNPSITQRLRQ